MQGLQVMDLSLCTCKHVLTCTCTLRQDGAILHRNRNSSSI